METQFQHLTMTQRNEFLNWFPKSEELFDRTLVTYKIDTVEFSLKEDIKPIWLIPYPVSKVHEEILKKEVEHLALLRVLVVANDSELGAPSSAQHNSKSN